MPRKLIILLSLLISSPVKHLNSFYAFHRPQSASLSFVRLIRNLSRCGFQDNCKKLLVSTFKRLFKLNLHFHLLILWAKHILTFYHASKCHASGNSYLLALHLEYCQDCHNVPLKSFISTFKYFDGWNAAYFTLLNLFTKIWYNQPQTHCNNVSKHIEAKHWWTNTIFHCIACNVPS